MCTRARTIQSTTTKKQHDDMHTKTHPNPTLLQFLTKFVQHFYNTFTNFCCKFLQTCYTTFTTLLKYMCYQHLIHVSDNIVHWQYMSTTPLVIDILCQYAPWPWHLMSIPPLALTSPVKSRLWPPCVDNICQFLAWGSARSCGSGGRCGITICKQYVVMVLDVLWNSCPKVFCLAHLSI